MVYSYLVSASAEIAMVHSYLLGCPRVYVIAMRMVEVDRQMRALVWPDLSVNAKTRVRMVQMTEPMMTGNILMVYSYLVSASAEIAGGKSITHG